jgi:hypothetical protein
MKKWIFRSAFGLALLGAGAFSYMELVKAGFIRYNRWDHRERGRLAEGQKAPDLNLALYDGGSLSLSSLWNEKPVFVVFGSCT